MTLEEKLDICKAWFEGKPIEIFHRNKNTWETLSHPQTSGLYLNFTLYDYRIKEKPKQYIAYCHISNNQFFWFDHELTDSHYYTRVPEFDLIRKTNEI